MSSVTSIYSFPKPGLDSSTNTWGTELNTAFDSIDSELYNRETEIKAIDQRNYIINPNFFINQQYGANTQTLANSVTFSDNWKMYKNTTTVTGNFNYYRRTGILGESGYNNYVNYCGSFKVVSTQTAGLAVGSAYYVIETDIEGYDYDSIRKNQYMILSFWCKINKNGTYSVSLANNAFDRSYIFSFSIATSTWQQIVATIPVDTTGTWEIGNSIGLRVRFCFTASPAIATVSSAWQAGNFFAVNRHSHFDTITNTFEFTQVQLLPGNVNYPFQNRFVQEELKLCERYFEKSYDLETPVAASTITGQLMNSQIFQSRLLTGGGFHFNINYRTPKRAAASLISYNPTSGVLNGMGTTDGSATAGYTCTGMYSGIITRTNVGLTATTQFIHSCHYVAKSQL